MRLEQQELDKRENQMALSDATEKLVANPPRTLWNEE
jgi:hypothetical protein